MRYLVLLAILVVPMLAADKKKKPVFTTKTKVQVGTPASSNKSTSSFGFGGLDRNGDGSLSRAEYLYNKNSAQGAEFDKLDTNKDGRLSRSEYR